ncbi:unnamed protein product [Amoebophrya sp. A25]|nr:unnamed protein product [Amoebophrya sp. A25]|eukprot:GSA25T00024997001.1
MTLNSSKLNQLFSQNMTFVWPIISETARSSARN